MCGWAVFETLTNEDGMGYGVLVTFYRYHTHGSPQGIYVRQLNTINSSSATPYNYTEWVKLITNSDLTTVEKFNLIPFDSKGRIPILEQNCYKVGNKVHIEFTSEASLDMSLNNVWAIIPSQYAPKTDTGSIGLLTLQVADDYATGVISRVCSCRVEVASDGQGHVYQRVATNVKAGYDIGFCFDYYI